MFCVGRASSCFQRFASNAAATKTVTEEVAKTTVDAGKQLEERVAKMLHKRGHINIKMNQRIKDKNGNWSEFDIVYGWPIKHYVECKNYSHPVKLEMVAKFKEVLRLHHIPRSRGLFVTTSTYTPRATTIGITCIDGAGLERLEKSATSYLLMKCLIVLLCGGGSYALYYYLCNTDSKKVKKWRDQMNKQSQQIAEQSKTAVKEVSTVIVPAVMDNVSDLAETAKESLSEMSETAKESVAILSENAKESVAILSENAKESVAILSENAKATASTILTNAKQTVTDFASSSYNEENIQSSNQENDEIEEEEWEAPSVWSCISTVFWGLLGYSEDA